ncbi:MAG: acyl-CoA dehydrogenase family protein [Acidimicrobiales bacterium]|jgi:alkylation response protein AidB-like acyl-CoA dehydrogenase|nr:acyl-CoA dehydrogenase family protein [Acidimicrobiales bacterium]MDP6650443.1 acyl-CoA dehydrogenase family protein [Acidimicrobiales bacterium]MDP6759596.1 acyl-CoA dehydrogenase family protein [Acidimicrobiales bacterium]|tara:strand:+ start:7131 stop:8282 length:1152 start_codon:yes stop_codon:yes gene_type:complete
MDVYLSPRQLEMRAEVRAFLDEHYPPDRILQMERDLEYPDDFYRECASRGWTGIPVPTEYGGSDGSVLDLCVFVEEVGKTSISMATLYITGTIFGSHALHICGSQEQAARYLPAIVTGDKRFALGMSEPGAGSDFAGMTTTAEKVEGGWRINGAKGPISGAERAETIITAARTGTFPDQPRQKGITLFLVDNPLPGLAFERREYLSMKALMVNDIAYDDVFVPDEAVLGDIDDGWLNLAKLMDPERLANAAQSIGVAQAAIDDAVAYARNREQYGGPISRYQAVSHPLAESQAEVAAARLLVYAAAHKRDVEGPCPMEASMAKMLANNVAGRATSNAMQVAGARGFEAESHFMRRNLEVRGCELGGGTSQIQRNIIAHHMGLR